VWDSGTFLPYGYSRGLLPTKTSRLFNQFSGGGTPRCQVKVLSPALLVMVGKLGCVPGACTSDGWCGYIWLCLVLCTCQVVCFFCKWAVRAVSPDELSLNQASSFYFTSGCMARYTDRCHSMFSKIVFITYMLLRKVGHCGDPPDGVFCGSPMFSICDKFCIFP
jgi:hypothetical protein